MDFLGYLIDENLPELYKTQLLRRLPELRVWRIGNPGAPATSTLDPEILIWCEKYDCVLVTDNRSTMPVHLAEHVNDGHHVPGIFLLNPNMSIGDTIEELLLLAQTTLLKEYQDVIQYLPVSYDLVS